MAAIDKIYGNRRQWNELHAFLFQTRPELIKRMYPCPEVDDGPIANFSYKDDVWLYLFCPLDFVKERILEQHGEQFCKIDIKEQDERVD